jgi:dihydrofolate reductase
MIFILARGQTMHGTSEDRRRFMRRLVLQTSVSIDGYVAALDGSHPWSGGDDGSDDDVKRWILDSVRAAGAHLMGRVTYEEMASFWPTSTSEYAAPMNEIPKVVFSTTIHDAPWPESMIAGSDLAAEIAALKNQPGGEIIAWGGASFVQALSRAGLIDEYAIITQPVAYGGGKPIFRDLWTDTSRMSMTRSARCSIGTSTVTRTSSTAAPSRCRRHRSTTSGRCGRASTRR